MFYGLPDDQLTTEDDCLTYQGLTINFRGGLLQKLLVLGVNEVLQSLPSSTYFRLHLTDAILSIGKVVSQKWWHCATIRGVFSRASLDLGINEDLWWLLMPMQLWKHTTKKWLLHLRFLVNCYLLHVPRLPSQPASNVGGLVIHWTAVEFNWHDST